MTDQQPQQPLPIEMVRLEAEALGSGVAAGRRQYKARFVRAGRVRAMGNQPGNIEVAAAALESATQRGMFNGRAVFLDHSGMFDGPSLRDLVGVTEMATWNVSEQAVEGTITLYKDNPAANLIDQLLQDGKKAPDVGLSMVFYPVWQFDEASKLRKVIDIKYIESVDLVFQPAADGRILQALSAQFSQHAADCDDIEINGRQMRHQWRTYDWGLLCLNCGKKVVNSSTNTAFGGAKMDAQSEEEQMSEELNETPTPEGGTQPAAGVASLQAPASQAANIDQQAQLWLPALRQAASAAILAASGLPQASRERLSAQVFNSPAEVDAAIEAERAYLARLSQDHVVQIGGHAPRGGHVQMGLDGLERLSAALDALLQGQSPAAGIVPLSGIREAYIHLSGDYEMTGLFHGDRVQFANVNSSTMAGLVANALNKAVVNMFHAYPIWWDKITQAVDFSNLQQVRWVTLGGVGELPTVAEGAAYTELTWDDQTETADFVKKGGYLGITLEAIDKDDTRRIQAAPRALAQAAWLTLSKAVSAIFTANAGVGPTLSDSLALFEAGTHANLGATALSLTTWSAARLAMRKQTELNSAERLGALTAPKYLLVPPDLEITGLQILASEGDYTYALANAPQGPANVFAEGNTLQARMASARERVIVVDLWTDTNNWAAVADPNMYPSIGLGFRYGRTPEIFSVASPTAGLMFSNDTMPVKVRFFFAVGPTDYRGLYKANVA